MADQKTPAEGKTKFRDIPVDIVRGLAILLMVMANLAPALLLPPAPGWFRILSSLAAPLFITVAGMMVALSSAGKGRTFGYFALRGGLTILCGALIQVIVYSFLPFIDVDVLYLIGLSLPAAWLYLTLPERKRWIVIIGILLVTPVLWTAFGYSEAIPEPEFTLSAAGIHIINLPGPAEVAKRWFVDGWFPIFPWLALALLGAEIGTYRWRGGSVKTFRAGTEGRYAAALLAGGGILWLLWPGAHVVRHGYVELFYPPVPGLLVFAAGLLLLVFIVLDHLPGLQPRLDPLRAAGECSLFIYILHLTIIAWVIEPLAFELPVAEYLLADLVLLAGMILVAYLLRYIRKSWHRQPFLVRFLIGG